MSSNFKENTACSKEKKYMNTIRTMDRLKIKRKEL